MCGVYVGSCTGRGDCCVLTRTVVCEVIRWEVVEIGEG